jgi:hypothetical protein
MGPAIAYGFGNSLKLKLRNYIHSPEKYIKENEKKFYALDIFEPEEFILPISIFSLIFSIILALTIYLAWQYLSENPILSTITRYSTPSQKYHPTSKTP